MRHNLSGAVNGVPTYLPTYLYKCDPRDKGDNAGEEKGSKVDAPIRVALVDKPVGMVMFENDRPANTFGHVKDP